MPATTINIEYPKSGKLDGFLRAVCAVFNTNGAQLNLCSGDGEHASFSDAEIDNITRRIEQMVSNLVGEFTATARFKRIKVSATEISFLVDVSPASCQLCTMNYNLYFPRNTQVIHMSSIAPLEEVIDFIEGEHRESRSDAGVIGNHHRRFVFGEALPFGESDTRQFKKIKDENSKKCDLASRITNKNNKLVFYVSAFASAQGGHIYYGVMDGTGVVEGESVDSVDKIISAVEKAIKGMLWPEECGEPTRGTHWEIFFESVLNVPASSNAKFVIVVSVGRAPRAVFAKPPESYKEVGGNVIPLVFPEWKKRLFQHRFSKRSRGVPVPQYVGHCSWSSSAAKDEHVEINDKLVRLRNDGMRKAFDEYIATLQQGSSCTGRVLSQQQQAGYYTREGNFDAAEELLVRNRRVLRFSKDAAILEARWLYWMCLVKRSRPGSLREAEELFTDAVQKIPHIPHSLVGPWLFVQKARMLETKIATECPSEADDDLVNQCKASYIEALREAAVLPDSLAVVALKQRVHISLARVFLGSFRCRDKLIRMNTCTEADREAAEKMLHIVHASRNLRGWTMTKLCRCEYRLARSEQDVRNWERFVDPSFLESAYRKCAKALKIARKIEFKVISGYASARLTYIENQAKEFGIEINEQEG